MKKTILLIAILGSAFVTQSFAADAKKKVTVVTDGQEIKQVIAQYEQVSPDGCIAYVVAVQADVVRETTNASGTTVMGSAYALVSIFDNCKPEGILFADGSTDSFKITVDPNLSTAHLKFTIQAFDQPSNGFVPVDIDLTWKATSAPQVSHDETRTFADGTLVIEKMRGVTRQASVKGTVIVKGEEFTSADSSLWFDNQILKTTTSTITVTKP